MKKEPSTQKAIKHNFYRADILTFMFINQHIHYEKIMFLSIQYVNYNWL